MSAEQLMVAEEETNVEVVPEEPPPTNSIDVCIRRNIVARMGNPYKVLHPWGVDSSIVYRVCRRIFGDSVCVCNGEAW